MRVPGRQRKQAAVVEALLKDPGGQREHSAACLAVHSGVRESARERETWSGGWEWEREWESKREKEKESETARAFRVSG